MAGYACPTGCGRTTHPGHLMCSRCWHEVPHHLQRDVLRTWRQVQAIRGNPRRNGKAAAREAYKAARDAALASIR